VLARFVDSQSPAHHDAGYSVSEHDELRTSAADAFPVIASHRIAGLILQRRIGHAIAEVDVSHGVLSLHMTTRRKRDVMLYAPEIRDNPAISIPYRRRIFPSPPKGAAIFSHMQRYQSCEYMASRQNALEDLI
jgi:hypothetical protein